MIDGFRHLLAVLWDVDVEEIKTESEKRHATVMYECGDSKKEADNEFRGRDKGTRGQG